jgi:hypothetical protein
LPELAEHLFRAGPSVSVERRIEWARRAAEYASQRYAWGESGRWYAAAEPVLADAEVADLDYRAGVSFNHDWDAGPCMAHYQRALQAYERCHDRPGVARALTHRTRATFTFGAAAYGADSDLAPLRAALESLGDDAPVLRGMGMATLSEALWTARQTAEAEEMARAALELGREQGDAHLCRNASVALGLAQVQRMDLKGAVQSFAATRSYARSAGDPWLAIAPSVRLTTAQIQLGRLAEAVTVGEEALREARRMHDVAETSLSLCDHALLAALRGRLGEVEELAREAMALAYRAQYSWTGLLALATVSGVRWLRGESAEAEESLSALADPAGAFGDPGPAVVLLVEVYRALLAADAPGDLEAEQISRLEGLARALSIAGHDAHALGPHCAMVEIAVAQGLPSLAEHARPVLEVASEAGVAFANGWPFSVERALALAEMLAGQLDEADLRLQRTAQEMKRLRAVPELAQTLFARAGLLLGRDRDGDRAAAQELCEGAAVLFEELEMTGFSDRLRKLAEASGLSLPPAAAGPQAPIHSQEVARRLARGQELQVVADELFLSPKTANGYLLRAFEEPDAVRGFTPAGAIEKVDETAPVSPRVLAILITDIVDFTPLIHGLGDELGHAVIKAHNRIVRECLAAGGGCEVAHTGDGMMVSFEAPSDALRCAIEIHEGFERYSQDHPEAPIQVRIGPT